MTITKEQFNKYEAIRKSGVTNMFDVKTVERLSKLTRDTIFYIMDNYTELKDKYN